MKPNHMAGVYARDYVTDYTSFENDDLMVFAEGNGQLEYEQKHVYAGSERIEQFTDKGNWERTLYVHEDVMGNTRYYTKANGQSFAELTYDAWGMPESPNKLLNNDHGNYVFATFTGHIYDTTLDIYFAEARFYDANNRTWLAVDPVKDGGNWYQYCYSNPTTYYDPTGLWGMVTSTKQALLAGSEIEPALFWRQRDFFNGNWWQNEDDLTTAYEMLLKEPQSRNMTIITLAMDYNYFDYFGYANTRVYALQALIGEGRTGVYDPATMTTLRNVLLSQYAEFDFEDPELTPDTLKAIRNWYDNSSEIGKQGTYIWENGWGNIISGTLLMGAGYYATRPVKGWSVRASDFTKPETESNGTARRTGADRSAKYSDTWQSGSVKDAINKFASGSEPVYTDSGKIIYRNNSTGIEVVYDSNGNYYRIVDTNLTGRRTALDINGNKIPNNVLTEKGTQRGITQSEYNAISHFNNTDLDFGK
jgi:RHS repeat-associated protein